MIFFLSCTCIVRRNVVGQHVSRNVPTISSSILHATITNSRGFRSSSDRYGGSSYDNGGGESSVSLGGDLLRRELPLTSTVNACLEKLNMLSKQSFHEQNQYLMSDCDFRETLEYICSGRVDMPARQWVILLEMSLKNRSSGTSYLIFDEMVKRKIVCNSVHMTGLLSFACSYGDFERAYKLFSDAVALGMQPSVHNFSPLLKNSNSTSVTREILRQMDYYGVPPNVISLTAAIKSCEPSGDWKFALELLDLMRATDIAPNEITYSCAISVASQGTAGNVALNLLREMQNSGMSVNLITYGSALVACARSAMWTEVGKLFAEMEILKIPIQESVLISVINVCRYAVLLLPLRSKG